jgi:5-hydroxyisourate hydrolase
MGLSTHILDTNLGRPAANVSLTLSRLEAEAWTGIGHGSTDADGRCKTLLGDAPLEASTYRIRFATSDYYAAQNLTGLYLMSTLCSASQTPPSTTTSPCS